MTAAALPTGSTYELGAFLGTVTDPNIVLVSERLIEWCTKPLDGGASHADLLGQRALDLAVVASGFAVACEPSFATPRSRDVCAQLVLMFLSTDDFDPNLIPDSTDVWEIGRFSPALRRWVGEFAEFHAALPADRAWFIEAFQKYRAGRRTEPIGSQLSVGDHWASRRNTVFVEPYLTGSAMAYGIHFSLLGPGIGECFDGAANAIWLANDLGSWGRGDDDLNIIDTYLQNNQGWTEDEAADRAIGEYNKIVERLRERLDDLTNSSPDSHSARFAEMVGACVDGNIQAMRELGFRYSMRFLARLDRVC